MWLIHETTIWNLKHILQDGYLYPSSKTKKTNYAEDLDHVFMSVLFDDTKIIGQGRTVDVLLFFPLEIMEKYKPLHWTSVWAFGVFHDPENKGDYKGEGVSVKYDPSKTPKQNATLWHKIFRKLRTKVKEYVYGSAGHADNEVVFDQPIPISEMAFIYLHKDVKPKFEVPKRIDTKQKLNKLIYHTF